MLQIPNSAEIFGLFSFICDIQTDTQQHESLSCIHVKFFPFIEQSGSGMRHVDGTHEHSWRVSEQLLFLLARNPADNVAVELNHTEIYIVCQVQDKAKTRLFVAEDFQARSNLGFSFGTSIFTFIVSL